MRWGDLLAGNLSLGGPEIERRCVHRSTWELSLLRS